MLKEGSQALTGHSIILNGQKLRHYMYRNQCVLRYGQSSVWVGIWSSQHQLSCVMGAVHHRLMMHDLPVLLEYVLLHQQYQYMWHCQAASEPDFLRTVDRKWNPIQLACTISRPQSSRISVVRTPKDFHAFSADQWLGGITASSTECLSGDSSKTRNFLCDGAESCVEMHGNHSCGDHTNIVHISAFTGFRT
jgi:hypothetical protein